jgi:NitT/TauT family transport system substrate-binding protein
VPALTTSVRLRFLWFAQTQFAGYLIAQHRGLAAQRGVELTCVPVDFALGPIDAVLDGDCQFAVASPAHVFESRAPHELVMLLTIQQRSSLVYAARRSAGIATFADIAGRRAGVWPGGEDLELRWALRRGGVAPSAVTFVPVNDTVDALASGAVDVAQLTEYHELFELAHRCGSLDDFTLLHAADTGAALLKDGLFARADWVERNPVATQAVVDSVLDGWTRAFRDPTEALDVCVAARPDLDRAHQADQLAAIRALALCEATLRDGLGVPDVRHIEAALAAVAEVDDRRIAADPATFVASRFWSAAPRDLRSAAW